MSVHFPITVSWDEAMSDDLGICERCGETFYGFEVDAHHCACPECGTRTVHGMEYAIDRGLVVIGEQEGFPSTEDDEEDEAIDCVSDSLDFV